MPDPALDRQQYFDQYAQPLPPNQGINDPAYQRQQQQALVDTWNRSKSIEQAQKDVSAQMQMMGTIRVTEAIKKGVPPQQAYLDNIHYFVQPSSPRFAPAMKAVTPPPAPYPTNFTFQGGVSVPAVVTGGRTQFVPRSALPQEPVTPIATNFPGVGPGVYNPKTGATHFPTAKRTLDEELELSTAKALNKIISTPYADPELVKDAQKKLDEMRKKESCSCIDSTSHSSPRKE